MKTGTVPEVEVDVVIDPRRYWWAFALSGVVSIVIGILVLAYPDISLKLLGVFLGIDLLIGGVALIVRGAGGLSPEGAGQGSLLLGILGLIAGVIVIRNPGETVALIAIAFAIFLVAVGAVALSHGLIYRTNRGFNLVKGLVLAGSGTLILSLPSLSLHTLAILVGVTLCVRGLVNFAEALVLRGARA